MIAAAPPGYEVASEPGRTFAAMRALLSGWDTPGYSVLVGYVEPETNAHRTHRGTTTTIEVVDGVERLRFADGLVIALTAVVSFYAVI